MRLHQSSAVFAKRSHRADRALALLKGVQLALAVSLAVIADLWNANWGPRAIVEVLGPLRRLLIDRLALSHSRQCYGPLA